MSVLEEAAPFAAPMPRHLVALRRANEVRLAGAAVKRELGRGTVSLADALEDARAGHLKVLELLMAQRRWGRERALKALARAARKGAPIYEDKRVETLTNRQKRYLLGAVLG